MAECLELCTEALLKDDATTEMSQTEHEQKIDAELEPSCVLKTTPYKHPPVLPPSNPTQGQLCEYLGRINFYINRLGYHHVGEPGIRVMTHLSLRHHTETARQIIKAGENIKCLHAMLLGIYFTNVTPLIERFPINFKSKVNNKEYRHVVLGIYLFGSYGALGLSRDPGLQDKPPTYTRLSELLRDYCRCYAQSGHVLIEIKVGGIIPRDTTTQSGIPWKVGNVLQLNKFPEMKGFDTETDKLARLLKGQMGQTCIRHLQPSVSRIMSPFQTTTVPQVQLKASVSKPIGQKVSTTAVKKKIKVTTLSKQLLPKVGSSTSSKLGSGSSTRLRVKPNSGSKGTKSKKKKVHKYKRYAEP